MTDRLPDPNRAPLVSVILATYNRAHLISRAIESVLNQTLTDFEFVIIDDGSTDETEQVVAGWTDPRIVYRKVDHGERSRARNIGVQISSGRYIAFLDSDDWYLPNKLAVQSAALDAGPEIGLALGGWLIVNESGQTILDMRPWESLPAEPTLADWLFQGTATPITVMLRREWFEHVKGFDTSLSFAEDTDLWIRLALAGCRSVWTRQPIATVLVHGTNSLRDFARVRQGRMDFLEKIFSLPGFEPNLQMAKDTVYSQFHLNLAWLAASNSDFGQVAPELNHAVEIDPGLLANGGAQLRASIINYSQYFLVKDPLGFAKDIFRNLPTSLAFLNKYRREVLAQVASSQAWRAHQHGYLTEARRHMLEAVGYSPAILKDRGVWAVLLKSFFRSEQRVGTALPSEKAA